MSTFPAALLALATFVLPTHARAPAQDAATELALIADGKAAGDARAKAIRSYMARAREKGECAEGAATLNAVLLERGFPAWLRRVGAEALAECGDEATAKLFADGISRGNTLERLHHLRAARGNARKPVIDATLRTLAAEDPRLRCEAAELLARHKVSSASGELESVVAKAKDRELLEPALRAVSTLRRGTAEWPAWEARLLEWAGDRDELRKRASIAELLADDLDARAGLALKALGDTDWSVRVLAIDWLARNPSPARLDALIARLGAENEAARVHGDINDTLAGLTGITRHRSQQAWSRWRETAGRDWKPGDKVGGTAEAGAGEQRSRAARFYGVEIASARTIYVVDLSGSMGALSRSKGDEKLQRIDVAKRELLQLIDVLPAGSWFNIAGFGDTVLPWLDALSDFSPGRKARREESGELGAAARKRDDELRAKARDWVRRLALSGSTNIYDAFAWAFTDPDVDTICFMTDGTPTIGTETEAVAIREELQRWNRSRRIRIHCIAVGEDHALPKWIAADHGGVHRFVP